MAMFTKPNIYKPKIIMEYEDVVEQVRESLDDAISTIDDWDVDDSLLKIRSKIEAILDDICSLHATKDD